MSDQPETTPDPSPDEEPAEQRAPGEGSSAPATDASHGEAGSVDAEGQAEQTASSSPSEDATEGGDQPKPQSSSISGAEPLEDADAAAETAADSPREEAAGATEEGADAADATTDDEGKQKQRQHDTKPRPEPKALPPAIAALNDARKKRQPVTGKVIGWNKGGFHVALGETPAFCPRSAISIGDPQTPESYLNHEMDFQVLEIRKGGKRVVVSRASAIRAERSAQRKQAMAQVKPGAVLTGTVVSLTDFGAFIDLGGVQGLLHVSEISRSRVEHPSDALEEGRQLEVKVLKVEKGGKRISLSRKALEPDPWQAIGDFQEGQEVQGRVERAEKFGVLVELAPGLSGLIPSSALNLPVDASPQRVYPQGKEMSVQIVSIDKKRKRISLLPEGAQVDASRKDLEEYRQRQGDQKLGALAAAFEKARSDS